MWKHHLLNPELHCNALYVFRHHICLNWLKFVKNSWNCVKSVKNPVKCVWTVCESMCTSVLWCVKAAPFKSCAEVFIFGDQTCLNWLKFGKDSQNCVKMLWKLCESVWTSVWKCLKVSLLKSWAFYMFLDTKPV